MIGELFKRTETRATTIELPLRSITSQAITGPISVTRDTLLSSVAANRCVALISDQIGAMPMHVERNGERIPTPTLLRAPEPDRTYSEFMSAVVVSMSATDHSMSLKRESVSGFPFLLESPAQQASARTVASDSFHSSSSRSNALHKRSTICWCFGWGRQELLPSVLPLLPPLPPS